MAIECGGLSFPTWLGICGWDCNIDCQPHRFPFKMGMTYLRTPSIDFIIPNSRSLDSNILYFNTQIHSRFDVFLKFVKAETGLYLAAVWQHKQ